MNQATTPVFAAVAAAFQSVEHAVKAANKFDRAYYEGVGNIGGHTPFDDKSNPQMVAMNQAGLYAADTAAHLMAMDAKGAITEEGYVDALTALANGEVSHEVAVMANLMANLAWRAGQPFRDLATKPFNRMGRDINRPWAALPDNEKLKDTVQVKAGAQMLLEVIEKR